MMWPDDPESEKSPSEMLLPSRDATVVVMITPTVVAIATPARNGKETLSALGAVTKMIADMICGPAIIVMARGSICTFMIPVCHRPSPLASPEEKTSSEYSWRTSQNALHANFAEFLFHALQ